MSPAETTRPARDVFRDLVVQQMQERQDLVCLDSDTGLYKGVDFGDATDRYINIGISEHTLMGTAAGLAREGMRPIAHTMAAFAASRAVEAVKIDIALNNLPVMIAATHAGLSAGHLGPTHHALEDLAAMRSLPNMTVIVPADSVQAEALALQGLRSAGPTYLRLGRGATPNLPDHPLVELGRAVQLRARGEIAIVSCGPYPTLAAVEAADALQDRGITASLTCVHTVKPLDVEILVEVARQASGRVVTVEEHWSSGGFGSAVVEALSELMPIHARRVGVADNFVHVAGGQQYLIERSGITPAAIVHHAEELHHGH